MSDYITENEWINKKISEGYFGFDVCELDKLYSEEEVKELKKLFNIILMVWIKKLVQKY